MAAPAAASASPLADVSEAAALAAVRRADWRFLLPEPALGRVAYPAPHDPALVTALDRVSRTVELEPRGDAVHDVVVLTGARPSAVVGAVAQLRSGGWLYAEVAGPAAGSWRRALAAHGLDEIGAHWLWPTAAAPREIVELTPDALRHALGRRDPGARLRVRAQAAGMLARSGAFALAVRHAAIVGRRA